MLIKNVTMLITKVEVKENKDRVQYIFLNLVDRATGDMFEIVEKDMTMLGNLKPFTDIKVNLSLTNSKYGLMLKLDSIL